MRQCLVIAQVVLLLVLASCSGPTSPLAGATATATRGAALPSVQSSGPLRGTSGALRVAFDELFDEFGRAFA